MVILKHLGYRKDIPVVNCLGDFQQTLDFGFEALFIWEKLEYVFES